MDLISRQAAINELEKAKVRVIPVIVRQPSHSFERAIGGGIIGILNDVEKNIKTLPAAQPKKGKWIEYEQEFMLEESLKTVQKTVKECSVCTAKIAGMVGIMNFCPNCGADMREETE